MFTGTLYPYQEEAFNLIVKRKKALIAYEMGLGKTPTSIAAVEHLMETGDISEPGMVFTLASLKYQWATSILAFTDSKPLVIDGTKAQREAQYALARDWKNSGYDYVIINYETLVADSKEIAKLPRGFLVMDESTSIKSFRSKRHKLMKRLSKDVEIKVGLTGTPMTNGKPEEVFAQFLAIDPDLLGRFDLFDTTFIVRNYFGGIERYRNLDVLHRKLSEAMISKLQTDPDVAPYLPKTIYKQPLLVTLDRAARKVYNRVVADLMADLDEAQGMFGANFNLDAHYGYGSDQGGPADELKGKIASKVTTLRMLCDHPELLRVSAREFKAMTGKGSQYIAMLDDEGLLDPLTRAPKLDALVGYMKDFLDADPANKVVVFSVFVPTLELIADRLQSYKPHTYSGRMNAKEKEAAKVKFQTDPEVRVLVSSDAGGYGVDLPQANLLINFDLPWASGTARQRNGRIQRASSLWEHVVIQNFLIKGSLEERQWDMLQQKNRIEAAVIEGKGIDSKGGVAMNVSTLRAFLEQSSV